MPGERIWYFRELADEPQLPSDMPVLYEDEHVLAIDKPHFLPTTPRGAYIAQTALTKLRVREQNPLLIPIHRLDRPTAGVLLFAKTVDARRPFQMMFQHRQVSKTYRAVAPIPTDAAAAEQALSAEGLQVRSHIQKIRDQLQVQQLSEQECAAQGVEPNTLTTVKILRTFTPSAQAVEGWRAEPMLNEKQEWALYDLAPHTGKTHQLRAHLNLLGSPILGDVLYPQVLPDAPDRPEYPLQLLAYSLHFEHPITGERVDLYSGHSADCRRLTGFEWRSPRSLRCIFSAGSRKGITPESPPTASGRSEGKKWDNFRRNTSPQLQRVHEFPAVFPQRAVSGVD